MQHPHDNACAASPKKLTIGVLYGFRALMVLIVCHFHIWQQSWLSQTFIVFGQRLELDFLARSGYMFVDGMILMSGFLLFLPYAREKAEGIPAPGWRDYAFNRATRILPSYWLAVFGALFLIAIPQHKYVTSERMALDIIHHLTFTFNFWRETLLYTPLNGALWTVAVEVQFYLIFPFLARAAQKKPVLTLGLMTACGVIFRFVVAGQVEDTSVLINQLPSFMDVYALGMLGAMLYVQWRKAPFFHSGWQKKVFPWVFAGIFALSLPILVALLKQQASATGFEPIRLSQMALRFPFALTILVLMFSAAMMPRFLQKLLNNRLLRFLSTISFHLYIWHQLLAVQIRQAFFPDTLHSNLPLQQAYTLLCFAAAILIAMLATYGVEQPCARIAQKWRSKRKEKVEQKA